MKVPAKKVTGILDLIDTKWRVGPTGLMSYVGYSRQAIHAWKKIGAPEEAYAKLESFLQNGPDHEVNNELSIRLNLKVDIINPTNETKAKVDKAISFLEGIRKIWAKVPGNSVVT